MTGFDENLKVVEVEIAFVLVEAAKVEPLGVLVDLAPDGIDLPCGVSDGFVHHIVEKPHGLVCFVDAYP